MDICRLKKNMTMDKNTIIGFLLLFLLFLGFSFHNSKKVKQQQEEKAKQVLEQIAEQHVAEQNLQFQLESMVDTFLNEDGTTTLVKYVTQEIEKNTVKEKPFSILTVEDESDYLFETNLAIYTIAKKELDSLLTLKFQLF